MSGKVSESVSKLESAVNDKNQDQNKITSAYEEVSKLLKNPEDIKEFNKAIADQKNDISALKGLSLVKIDEKGNMEFSSAQGQNVEFNSKSNFKSNTEKDAETNAQKPLDFKTDEQGKAKYEVQRNDTIWSVAERICTEKNQGKPVSQLDVWKEMNNIIKENPQIGNPNRIKEGRDTLTLPQDSAKALQDQRKATEDKQKTDESSKTPTKTDTPPNNTETKTDTPPNNTETKTDTPPNSTETKTDTPQCQTESKTYAPEQRTDFLIQEQNWMLSKGKTKATIFEDIDADGDTYLTPEEINKYREQNTIGVNKNHDAYLKELAQKRGDIEKFNNDELGFENNGISKQDLTAWTDSETLADKLTKEKEQRKVEQDKTKAEQEKANQEAKTLLTDEKFFLRVSGYDDKITISDVDKYAKELSSKQPANETEKQQIEKESKALVQIREELKRRSTTYVRPKTDEIVCRDDGVMKQEDSQNWKN